MELLNDAQYLNTMLNDEYGVPKLINEFRIKNGGISHRLLNLSYILNVGKDVSNIMSNICAVVDETDMVFEGEMWRLFNLNQLLLLLLFWCFFVEYGLMFLCKKESLLLLFSTMRINGKLKIEKVNARKRKNECKHKMKILLIIIFYVCKGVGERSFIYKYVWFTRG